MRLTNALLAVLIVALSAAAVQAAGSGKVGVVVRDGADANWAGAIVMKDILQQPTIVGLLPEGTEVDILQHLSNKSFTYIVADGIRGWVKNQYIQPMNGVQKRRQRAGIGKPVVFADIPAGHWARRSVERMVSAGLIERHSERFSGDKSVTRYELATVLDRTHRRAEQSRESVEARLRALEGGHVSASSGGSGRQYHHLLTLSQTIRSLQAQSEELKGRLDALEPGGSQDVVRRLRQIEHRLDTIERSLGNG